MKDVYKKSQAIPPETEQLICLECGKLIGNCDKCEDNCFDVGGVVFCNEEMEQEFDHICESCMEKTK